MSPIKAAYFFGWKPINEVKDAPCNTAYFAFYIPDANGNLSTENKSMVESFLSLKNQGRKVIASIGGWSAGVAAFSTIANNYSARQKFISNVVNLTEKFDGVDIDWEYPSSQDKDNFVTLLSELYSKLHPKGKHLGIAVSAGKWQAEQSYDIRNIARYVDNVNMMTYDYQYPRTVTGHNAPYCAVKDSIQYWINNGCPSNKIILGLAAYGYKYGLTTSSRDVGSPATGCNDITYREIVQKINSGWQKEWDTNQCVPYIFSRNEWISYDDPQSISKKLGLIRSMGLGGYFFWGANQDDYDGSGGHGKFPLLRTAYNKL